MLPIDSLMREHRLIERVARLIKAEIVIASETKKLDLNFIRLTLDFLQIYADRCHHGKEEDILFRELAVKNLSKDDKVIMDELILQHAYIRKTVKNIAQAAHKYASESAESAQEVLELFGELTELYPKHIEKEDKHFFYPCMKYFTLAEQQSVLQEFWEFDRKMIHEKYTNLTERMESTFGSPSKP